MTMFWVNMRHAERCIYTSHAALLDIVVEITGYGKIISIISTKNHDMLLRRSTTA
jgi:hypothetical protein